MCNQFESCPRELMKKNQPEKNGPASVTQIFNLLYRRLAVGRAHEQPGSLKESERPQITNLRYSRLQVCVTPSGWANVCSFGTGGVHRVCLLAHFPAMLFDCRIIHSSFLGRASAP
jgi:hypothetical protein